MMEFQSYFPIWDKLTAAQRELILGSLTDLSLKHI